ncbi:TRIO and F-actin-binding protein isoform X1 [Anolis carolinensis]|nr:PREDICTED: TRIO and F-actin-binding protein isoform X1 [Anolis carolinensis]XP_008108903.1 PREDICTED: TRIO and F-actin-binding protein isoform X1 [Anolis carolinensis]|eukprot:XP_008108902.1 PREDICTED: TRIO and F-actin-binding protein isoform X1 [Anolis carolinensis]
MSEMAEPVTCEKFEANVFAKSRCQNCFRTVAAHQCGNQEVKEKAVKTSDFAVDSKESSACDPWDPLCILVPQCELYVCVGSEDKTESWQESLEYTQLSCKVEDETEEASPCPDANTLLGIETDTNDTLPTDWEMTRLLNSILGSDKGDMMYYAGQKQAVQPESLPSDRPRWAEAAPSGRTESKSRPKTECRTTSQDDGDSRRKRQADSSYFSLERQKSDPTRASSPSPAGRSTLLVHGNAKATGGWPASSVSSVDSDMSWRTSGSHESRHGLMRQEYTVLADVPKTKRLNHRQAFEKDRSSSRTQSPGRAEVERIFGLERRKSETLEAFQALEEGLLERLDSKTLKLAKEGRLVRRQSSPTLRKEPLPANKKLPWESGQPSKSGGESLRSGRQSQRPERTGRSQGESLRSRSPAQQPERESRSRGTGVQHPAAPLSQRAEKKRPEEPVRTPRAPLCSGRQTDSGRKSHPETVHLKVSSKTPDTKWKTCLDVLHIAKPAKSVDKSQVSHKRPLERYKESDRKARGKPLLPVDTSERVREDSRDRQEAARAFSPGRGTAAREKTGQAPSPPRHREVSRGTQGETRSTVNSGRDLGVTLKSHRDAGGMFSLGRSSGGSQQESRRSLSPGRCRESNWKDLGEARRSPSPGRLMEGICACSSQGRCCAVSELYAENSWKSQRVAARNQSDWPSKEAPSSFTHSMKENSECKYCSKSLCPTSLPVPEQRRTGQEQLPRSLRPESSSRSQEGSLCHVHPMQLLEREWTSQREHQHTITPEQSPVESNLRTHRDPPGWVEEENQEDQSPMRPELQMGNSWNNEEKLFHQHELDGGQPPKSTCSPRSHDPYLDTSKKHKPDLLNFKKGWMSILDEPGEWTKHWFVLTDSSLRYYRDSNAEEADDLDGEIDLRSCTDVTEYAVQRNYGFQIHTKDGVFTLSAMTSGIRRNWIEALRKSIRPTSVPDVTKLSDCNKENSFRGYGSPKSSIRPEEQRPSAGPEAISRGSHRKADGQHHAFDYVELSPLQQGSQLSHGSPQRTRGSARATEAAAGKREDLERDLALRWEERRKWFESPASGVLQTDGPAGDLCQKGQEPPGPHLSETQKSRLSEEIEKKWQELERLPLKDSKRIPLMALLNQGKGNQGEKNEALEKEVQVLRSQLESFRAHNVAKSHKDGQVPRGYISQEACERSLAEMETSHQQVMTEMQRHHQREVERLQLEKERLLSEEASATAAAIEALKKAHRDELNKELSRTRNFQKSGSNADILQQQHQSDVESMKRELQVLSEQYSQKCLEIGDLVHKAEEQEHMLQRCQQEGKELLRQNQELQRRLSEEIGQLRAFITAQVSGDGSSHNSERNSCELEVLLRVKENELQYLKQEVQCLREEIQMMQKDKRFASGKYQDVYAELNHIKRRSEREIEQLKEHLRLAMAALQEKEMMHNSIGQ